jgi:quercetin 2,3-dioxygenase
MAHTIYRAQERGSAEHGWLHARFSFSFAEYYNPNRMGFGVLRVLNNDTIEADKGFSMHPHNNMEIITLVIRGTLEHRDSQGRYGIINAGEVQYMSAGEGVFHSEKNPSREESVELFQIWIYPNEEGGEPLYEKLALKSIEKSNQWNIVVSADARENSIKIKQDALLYTAKLEEEMVLSLDKLASGRGRLLMVIDGSIEIGGHVLNPRDEMQITDEDIYTIKSLTQAHIMMFEVPMKNEKI